MKNGSAAAPGTRTIALSVDIASSPEAVWQAVSEGDRLANWFAPIASVDPGEGGTVTVGWAEGADWTSVISVWRPVEHLQLVDEPPAEAAAEGAVPMVLDYHLEPREGGTRVHLVNSGLSASKDWDDAFHMMTNGWRFFLWNLKHYLERHSGTGRNMISERPWVTGPREDVWDTIFGAEGLGMVPTRPGEAFSLRLDGGTALEGTTILSDRPWAFAGMVSSLNDGILHVELEGTGERWKMGVWISAYGVEEERCKQTGEALGRTISRLFPGQG